MTTAHRRVLTVVITALGLALGALLAPGVPAARAADTGVITGTVLGKPAGGSATAMQDARVVAYEQLPEGGTGVTRSANTGAGGTYSITGLPAGEYEVRIYPSGAFDDYAPEYYDDAWIYSSATIVEVGAGSIALDDVVLEPAGWVTGRITDQDGAPLANSWVSLQEEEIGAGYGVQTDAQGYYDTRDNDLTASLPPGDYLVSSSGPDSNAADDAVYGSLERTATVPAGAGTTRNLQLTRRKTVVFTVRDAAGDPVVWAPVQLRIQSEPGGQFELPQYGPITTDDAGKFRVVDYANAYKLGFQPDPESGGDEVTEWYDGADGAATEADARAIQWPASAPIKRDITVDLGPLTGENPTVAGDAVAGETLTATSGAWTPAAPDLSWAWTADGEPIAGQTGATLRLTRGLVGSRIAVTATASIGDTSVSRSSEETAAVRGAVTSAKPKIAGKAQVGRKLRAKPGKWGPKPVTLRYTWLRNGKVIKGAGAASYKVKRADRGKRIQVRAIGTKSGYVTARATSRAVKIKR